MHRFCRILLGSVLILGLHGCGGDSSTPPPQGAGGVTGGGGGGGGGSGGAGTFNITINATPTSLIADGVSTSTITATVTNSGVLQSGRNVTFTLDSSPLGAFSPAGPYTTNGAGVATVTYTAGVTAGTDIVTATDTGSGASASTTLTINAVPPPPGGIQFISATPSVIGIAGGGQPTTSNIIFLVTASDGSPVPGAVVNFVMNGPSGGRLPTQGGEYIGSASDGTPTIDSANTGTNGQATVTLNSGAVAGPVTIRASVTVGSTTYTAASSVISIGGGVPSATHFNLATSRFNLKGLIFSGQTATIDAFVADRFGNYNVLQGTSVSFYTEAGAIDTSAITDATGFASVTFRTQAPRPVDGLQWTNLSLGEQGLINSLNTRYLPFLPTGGTVITPRNGWVTVLATVMGEETFVDTNGNGLYDSGEPFIDIGEPFIDANNNGVYDVPESFTDANSNGVYDPPEPFFDCNDNGTRQPAGADESFTDTNGDGGWDPGEPLNDCNGNGTQDTNIAEPFVDTNGNGSYNTGEAFTDTNGNGMRDVGELYIDANQSGTYNPPNGVWDGPGCPGVGCQTSKMIWDTIILAFTGNAAFCDFALSSGTFDIGNGESRTVSFMVGDENLNSLVPGTTIGITSSGAVALAAPPAAALTVPDGIGGPTEISFTISDPDPATNNTTPAPYTLTITVTPVEGVIGCFRQISGTTD